MALTPELPGLPTLAWTHGEGLATPHPGEAALTMVSRGGDDWVDDASGAPPQHSASSLGFLAAGDLMLSARVRVDAPRSTFDAGVLTLWADDAHYAKLCFERAPQGSEMVVSIVTDRWSDDVNSGAVDAGEVYLRVARIGPAWAFHRSADGHRWDFVRLFRLNTEGPVRVGFMAQAPLGPPCTARFDQIRYTGTTLTQLRDGS